MFARSPGKRTSHQKVLTGSSFCWGLVMCGHQAWGFCSHLITMSEAKLGIVWSQRRQSRDREPGKDETWIKLIWGSQNLQLCFSENFLCRLNHLFQDFAAAVVVIVCNRIINSQMLLRILSYLSKCALIFGVSNQKWVMMSNIYFKLLTQLKIFIVLQLNEKKIPFSLEKKKRLYTYIISSN